MKKIPVSTSIGQFTVISKGSEIGEHTIIGHHTVIEKGAVIGNNVRIGHHTVIHEGTVIGDGASIGSHCALGVLPSGNRRMRMEQQKPGPLIIRAGVRMGNGVTLYASSTISEVVFIGDHASIRENVSVGPRSVIGRAAIVELNTVIGADCTIQTLVYVTGDTTIEDDVFLGPCVSMSNDKYMGLADLPMKGPTIKKGAKIGNNATLLPSISIGAGSVVGAGTVVTKDVPDGETIVGAYGKPLRKN